MNDIIRYRLEGDLALIGLNRPPVNALGQPLRAAIIEACEHAESNVNVSAIIIHGGRGLFSAGGDISEFGTDASFAWPSLPDLFLRLTQIKKPIIAAIRTLALGGGLELALACGYRVCEPNTHLGFDNKLGLLPGAGATQRLPWLIGIESALALILSGEQVNAEKARELGLVDRVATSTEDLMLETRAYARQLIGRAYPEDPSAIG